MREVVVLGNEEKERSTYFTSLEFIPFEQRLSTISHRLHFFQCDDFCYLSIGHRNEKWVVNESEDFL
jgi:hypothetical protein